MSAELSQHKNCGLFSVPLRCGAGGRLLEKLPGSEARDADGWDRIRLLAESFTRRETVKA